MPLQEKPVALRRAGGVAIVTIALPPANALSQPVRRGLLSVFRSLAADSSVKAVVLTGAGGTFVGGADLREMDLPPNEPRLPVVVAAIEACPQPVVAAMDGAALGGGFELALACDLRLASPSAGVGLPETKLGLVPGAGGTQRLPRLVGIPAAIELISQGRIVPAALAAGLGLVDRVVEGDLLAAAVEAAPNAPKRRLSTLPVPPGPAAAVETAAVQALRRGRGNPAVAEAVALVRQSATLPFAAGLALEREAFLRLRVSKASLALRHLFFAEREARRIPGLGGATARSLERIAVVGAGAMGSGIAAALADVGLEVLLLDRDEAAAAAAAARVQQLYARQVAGGRLSAAAAEARLDRITAGDDWRDLASADLVIEAVFEDPAVKAEVFRRLDAVAGPNTLLASNTSYLDLDQLAAVTQRPDRVLGLHFFSPPQVMRLVEVVRGRRTSAETLASGLALVRRLGKLPVVAGVSEGFIGNRIFAAYRRFCEYLVEDGASPEQVDRAMEGYGFAMGPFAVFDLAGLDIAWAYRKRRAATRDRRERYVRLPDLLCERGRLGRKAGRGWYRYSEEGGGPLPDPEVRTLIEAERRRRGTPVRRPTAKAIVERLLAVMANEGAHLLEEGVALRPSDIDLVLVHGYGFPAAAGGPLYAADQRGLAEVLREVRAAAAEAGAGFEPAPLLVRLAAQGGSFAAWSRQRGL